MKRPFWSVGCIRGPVLAVVSLGLVSVWWWCGVPPAGERKWWLEWNAE